MDFKVGDRVRLMGRLWGPYSLGLVNGQIVTIQSIDEEGSYEFVGYDGDRWDVTADGWEVELNMDSPSEHFAKTVAKFWKLPLSTEDAEKLKTLGEQLGISSFEQSVSRITAQIAELLIEKNAAYGDSALNPIRVFSKSDRIEQLNVRIDDKISRIQRGSEYGNEDTEMDLIGYLVLRKIARESE